MDGRKDGVGSPGSRSGRAAGSVVARAARWRGGGVWVWMGLGRGSEGRDPGPGWIEQNVGCRGGGAYLGEVPSRKGSC